MARGHTRGASQGGDLLKCSSAARGQHALAHLCRRPVWGSPTQIGRRQEDYMMPSCSAQRAERRPDPPYTNSSTNSQVAARVSWARALNATAIYGV